MNLLWLILIIPACYFLISLFFLCFPNIFHKRHRYKYPPFNDLVEGDKKFCIGHRGGGFEGPQNTLQTFYKNAQNMHMFELDVCLTKDRQLVVHHDANLMRTCGVAKDVAELDYNQLPKFKKHFQAFGGDIVLQTQQNKIPLLDELFEKFPTHPMNIELKTPSTEAINEFNRLVRKYRRQQITVWGIAGGLNEQLRQTNTEVENFYSAGQVFKIFLWFLSGLLPFICFRRGFIDIPHASQGFWNTVMKFAGDSCLRKFILLILWGALKFFNFTSYLWIPHFKKRGIITFYWILNQQDSYRNALSKDCCGVMTDQTLLLKNYLIKENLYYNQEKQSIILKK